MTYLEKYLQENPDEKLIEKIYWDLCPRNEDGKPIKCPFLGKTNSELRNNGYCKMCWNQEIPEELYPTMSAKEYNEKIEQDDLKLVTVYSDGCEVKEPVDVSDYDLKPTRPESEYDELLNTSKEILKHIQGPLSDAKYVPYEKIIKDSGERREFETGAVRDIQKGKGRCDLMPLDVVSCLLLNNDTVLDKIHGYQKTGDIGCLYLALGCFKDSFYPEFATMLLEVSKHFEAGAEKYSPDNWKKGIPTHCYIDSAVRHYLKHLRGDQDEPHDRAFVWNILCCIWTCINKPYLDDYRKYEKEG